MATVNENVQYTLTLKDFLTGNLHNADTAAKGLETTMGGLKGLLSTLGIGFAVFKGAEFIKDSVESFHHLEQATAQVRAGLASTKGAAGLTFQDVEASAKSLSSALPYSRAQLMEMQSILLTFPSVTKSSFTPASEIIADMSTRLGQDLKSSAIQVGKALQDPIKGVTALRRVGVNFNEQQTQMIKNMVLSGHAAQAQAAIMKELRTEFEGSAKAAAEADPLFAFNKAMGKFKMSVGEAATEVIVALKPALAAIGNGFISAGSKIKTFVEFLKEHSIIVKAALVGLAAYVVALKAYSIGVGIAHAATVLMTASTWSLNAAFAANPVGVVVVSIAALVALMYTLYEKVEKVRAAFYGLKTLFTEGDFSKGWEQGMKAFKSDEFEESIDKKIEYLRNLKNEGKITETALNAGINRIGEELNKAGGEHGTGLIGKEAFRSHWQELNALRAKGIKGEIADNTTTNISTKGATGQKSVTINVSIGKLIEQFKVSTVTMKEGANQVEEMVANALLRAINEFQVHTSV
ncbi:Bacteriophage lambda, GpH, tail tape measure, N-terminal [uncultured Caudovirales phage]|uniref:Bacteriophage lambda, GpH, tail tape measure, N-terminal n=1 Tax=uncultured Caudovirales phage TaxID=2100421 RepID=A0A6J5KZ48_9CAUD|nr:Bacteriophage lambda, GpH, tail tape measure, N-terminal [uncultured Caudovirales phage]CAB5171036.1 Bacteriophage lambda, GpH, tail tape measure, N-terminal [uncultured Caudovirales phage]